jgi:hypothetical protein
MQKARVSILGPFVARRAVDPCEIPSGALRRVIIRRRIVMQRIVQVEIDGKNWFSPFPLALPLSMDDVENRASGDVKRNVL